MSYAQDMRCFTIAAGTCRHPERVVLRGGRLHPITMPSLVGVVRHPKQGLVLFDAGYAPRLTKLTERWPDRIYRSIVPFEVSDANTAAAGLRAKGFSPDEVRHVVVSHLHPDHIGGLRDFRRATIHLSRAAYDDNMHARGLRRLKRAFSPGLLPDDLLQRVHFLPGFTGERQGALGQTIDLFGDGSLRLVDLPGHAAGQVGMLCDLGVRQVLFAADAAWMTRNITEGRPPSRLTHLIAHDPAAARATLSRLAAVLAERPDLQLIPSHCPDHVPGELGA